ncbi:hypothetical protein Nit79A3_2160 [Nitrosomonas sp. Is79A3]|uniref:hypothetical protein n=1 Tax=Nitrosomonas sp. (strain Is79A3) TaxID=261292 RepID=UPI000215D2EA
MNAGLTASGYSILESNRLNFCTSLNESANESISKHIKKYNVRWEHFRHTSKPDVIVAWITHDTEINSFIDNFGKRLFDLNLNLLDPENYSGLNHGIYIYALDNLLNSGIKENKYGIYPQLVKFHHHDQSEKLTERLKKELNLRRIEKLSEVAIIAEQGSDTANKLAESLKNLFDPDNKGEMQFSYFKGLDANQQAIKKRDEPDNQTSVKNWSDYFSLHAHENPSIGHAQFDYLHRLAQQIKDHNKTAHTAPTKDRIKAVGIFGSDFYDKLIILEALWRENPNIVYFTTDLDAQMLQPEYWDWVRNLVVATHFDLRLRDDLQKQIPPFRDSRQTGIFYQTRMIFSDNKKDLQNAQLSPLIFEIGRNGPVYLPLSITNLGTDSIHPNYDQQKQLIYSLSFVFLITIALILTEYQMRPNSGAQTFWLSGTAIFLFLIIALQVFFLPTDNEPFSFTDGISTWPTILIRTFTILLVLAFIIKLIWALETNFYRMNRRRGKEALNLEEGSSLRAIFRDTDRRRSEEEILDHWEEIRTSIMDTCCKKKWIKVSIFFMLFGIASYVLSTLFDFDPRNYQFIYYVFILLEIIFALILLYPEKKLEDIEELKSCFAKLSLLLKKIVSNKILTILIFIPTLFVFLNILTHPELTPLIATLLIFSLLIYSEKDENEKMKSIQEWVQNDSGPFKKETFLWKEYREHGMLEQRLLRTTIMWLIFMNIDIFLTHMFTEHSSFCRGFFSCDVMDDLTLVFSSSFVIFLILLVLDAQRLCIHWIEKLRTQHPLLVDETKLNKAPYCDMLGLIDSKKAINDPSQSLEEIITLVAKRTRAVDQLIYFPIIALMLMFFARIVYFDFLEFPISSGITFTICISLLLYAGLKLRSEANRLKLNVIDTIENQITSIDIKDKKEMIRKIQEVNYGAFQPMSEQPVVRSALLLLGSLGLFAAEYLMLFGY